MELRATNPIALRVLAGALVIGGTIQMVAGTPWMGFSQVALGLALFARFD
jgi:hypothetical protein